MISLRNVLWNLRLKSSVGKTFVVRKNWLSITCFTIRNFGVEADFTGPDGKQKLYRPIPQQALNLNTANNAQNEGY